MTSSQPAAATVEEYLDRLPPDRREVVGAVRDVVAAAMPEGYSEGVAFGMITWSIPLERYPTTYNGQPLGYVGLAAQKRHYALYLMGLYADSDEAAQFRSRWEAGVGGWTWARAACGSAGSTTSTSTSLGRWWPGPACRPTWSATNGCADSPADVHGGQLHAAVSGEPGGLLFDVPPHARRRR